MKLWKDYVRIKFHRSYTSEKSDMYEFRMSLFDNLYQEEFKLFKKLQDDALFIGKSDSRRKNAIYMHFSMWRSVI